MWLRVQRSALTSMRATTRSLSASVKMTPFSSANGSFMDWIFSSGVMGPLRLLQPAPFRDEQRGCLGRFAQRVEIDIFVETVHCSPAGAEAQARNVVVQSIEPRIRQRGEDQIFHGTAIDRVERRAEGGFRRSRILQLIALRQETRPFHGRRVVGEE